MVHFVRYNQELKEFFLSVFAFGSGSASRGEQTVVVGASGAVVSLVDFGALGLGAAVRLRIEFKLDCRKL